MISDGIQTVECMGFDFVSDDVDFLVDRALNGSGVVINTMNPHSYVQQLSDVNFRRALRSSDFLLPDGSGIVFASTFLSSKPLKKIAGFDLFVATAEKLELKRGKLLLLGSTEQVLALMKIKLGVEYPNVMVETLAPAYKEYFDSDDLEYFVRKIKFFEPDVLFVGLTAPKQEKLIASIRDRINVKYCSGIGAVFDFYAGTVRRPSSFWIALHLEWLVRFVREPRRLWRRNLMSAPIFIIQLFRLVVSRFLSQL